MVKSRAEIQREYRERKKAKEGKSYMKKESQRVLKYYESSDQLSKSKKNKRNEIAKKRNQKHRNKVKAEMAKQTNEEGTSGYESGVQSTSKLIVKLPLKSGKANGGKKTYARALARAHKNLKNLENDKLKYFRKYRAKLRQYERLQKRIKAKPASLPAPNTPKSKTEKEIVDMSLTPKSAEKVRRKLLLKNTIMDEIRSSRAASTSYKDRRSVVKAVSGRIAKKYKLLRAINRETGIGRNTLSKQSRNHSDKMIKNVRKLQGDVIEFLKREDNSRTQPGKKDVSKTEDGGKVQTMVLTDYLANLHNKFCAENTDVKLSLATFCRLRPRHILLAKFISRSACLCIRHQNMALKCSSLKKYDVKVSENPEKLIGMSDELDKELETLPENVTYKRWCRVEVDEKKKMKVVEKSESKQEFIKAFNLEKEEFSAHTDRVRAQYHEIKQLKEKLPAHNMIVQMDFAENYSCKSIDEIQSAYWNMTSVTLHPIVVYYCGSNGSLEHQSHVIVSNVLSHSTSTVCAFLDTIIPKLRNIDPDLQFVHYWTDSPSSQYRNKTMFHMIAQHETLYGVPARWNYFEAGHGKGPCDGLGGTVKRMADEAIKRGAAVIQDAQEFYDWAVSSTIKGVKFWYVDKDVCEQKLEELNREKIKPIKGTMKIHCVAYDRDETLLLSRETSCYCDKCLSGSCCETWEKHTLNVVQAQVTRNEVEATGPANQVTRNEVEATRPANQVTINEVEATRPVNQTSEVTEVHIPINEDIGSYEVNDYIACVYHITERQKDWFVGKILEKNVADNELEVTFMEKAKSMYRWPRVSDTIMVPLADILYSLDDPEPSGKSQRSFKVKEEEIMAIEQAFSRHTS